MDGGSVGREPSIPQATRCPAAAPLAILAQRREVVSLPGFDRHGVAAASEDLGAAGIRVALYPLRPQTSFAGLIEALLDDLATTLGGLWPAWFAGAADFSAASTIAIAVIHGAAGVQAERLGVSEIWLRRAAEQAAAGRLPRVHDVPPGTELGDLCATIAAATGARRLVVCLDAQGTEEAFGGLLEGLCRWIVNHADVAVWLAEPAARWRFMDLFRRAKDTGPPPAPVEAETEPAHPPAAFFCGIEGLPNPNSPAEVALWRALSRTPWAAPFACNRVVAVGPAPRVDVLWQAERVVVEIDGDDHRSKAKYAQDREREFALLHAGYLVLRLTNEQVLSDLQLSLAKVKAILALRRGPAAMAASA